MYINSVLFSALIISSTQGLTNLPKVCKEIKHHLSIVTSNIKNLEPEKRDEIWQTSFRGLAYDILQKAFKGNPELDSINASISMISELREKYYVYSGDTYDQITEERTNFEAERQQLLESQNAKIKEYSQLIGKMDEHRPQLDQLRTQVLQGNAEIQQRIDKLNELQGIHTQMQQKNIPEQRMISILRNLKQKIFAPLPKNVKAEDISQPEKNILHGIRILGEIRAIENAIETKRLIHELLQKPNMPKMMETVADNLETMKNVSLNILQKISFDLQARIQKLKQALFKSPGYEGYFQTMEIVNDLRKRVEQTQAERFEFDTQLENVNYLLEQNHWKHPRITPEEKLTLESKTKNLYKAIATIRKQFNSGDIWTDEFRDNVQQLFEEHRKQDLKLLEEMKTYTEAAWQHLRELLAQEKSLDDYLAKIFAEVYVYWDSEAGATRMCFSHEELSMYIFYMSAAQIIISKQNFLQTLLSNLTEQQRSDLTLSLFGHHIKPSYMENQFKQNDGALQTDPNQSSKTYALILNTHLDKVFKIQRDRSGENISTFYYVLEYLGITRSAILELTKETLYNMFMEDLAVAILGLFGVSAACKLLVEIMTSFLSYLSDTVLEWLSEHPTFADDAKRFFLNQMAIIYKKLFVKEVYSLKFETSYLPNRAGDGSSLMQNFKYESDEQIKTFSSFYDLSSNPEKYYLEYSVANHLFLI